LAHLPRIYRTSADWESAQLCGSYKKGWIGHIQLLELDTKRDWMLIDYDGWPKPRE
jgi:hypothetical protein